ncbi:hypothetical protein I3843_02G091100 [Carya illinoinensis]|uniref:EF-hand domain-containing protein n=1 Tax=Carya illinoinensis TaxID=32201 RepID=A0A922K4Y7_CARIL|nr:hypothetical protein I3842_02G104700 [Carya illinoinensis]KAG7991709.1 hypothetical protein I3843_02G091100 [Carya illinoinensis]
MDKDRDLAVSFAEVNAYFLQLRYNRPLDRDRDGRLSFREFLTMNHILRTRPLWYRKSCGSCLRGLYFTCSYCFDSHGDTTYDLCPDL